MTAQDAAATSGPRLAEWAVDYPTDQDIEIAGFLNSGRFQYATADEPWGPWVIVEHDVAIGGAGFHGPPSSDGHAEIGYHLCPSRRGRGIATAVVGILADLARSHGATMLVAGTDPSNVASQRVLERSGFVQIPSQDEELRWTLSLES